MYEKSLRQYLSTFLLNPEYFAKCWKKSKQFLIKNKKKKKNRLLLAKRNYNTLEKEVLNTSYEFFLSTVRKLMKELFLKGNYISQYTRSCVWESSTKVSLYWIIIYIYILFSHLENKKV